MRKIARAVAILGLVATVVVFIAWRSGDRAPIDEIAIARSRVSVELDSRQIDVGDVTLHVVLAGPEDGSPVLLLNMRGMPVAECNHANEAQ